MGGRATRRMSGWMLSLTFLFAAPAVTHAALPQCDGVAPVDFTDLQTIVVADGLDQPLFVTALPGDDSRIFILEQSGRIVTHQRGDAPNVNSVFMDITDRVGIEFFGNEMGLLGLAFSPDFDGTGDNVDFFVNYTETDNAFGGPRRTVVSSFKVDATDPNAGDPASEVRLLVIGQPETNHNGGQVFFGDDRFLYVFTGDGGGSGDQHGSCGNGQDTTVLLGKILRLDVLNEDPMAGPPDCGGGTAYEIPSSNPFVTGGSPSDCNEIWAYGLRNPWRSAYDAEFGDVVIADVGQNSREEINFQNVSSMGGENYGWRVMEGEIAFDETCDDASDCTVNPAPFVCPLETYDHSNGNCSITGGEIYRGCRLPALRGEYFYGDFCSGFVSSLEIDRATGDKVAASDTSWTASLDPLGDLVSGLTSFGTNARGELFIVDQDIDGTSNFTGAIKKVLPLFADMEVSGEGAGDLLIVHTPAWTWEDLAFETEHPVSSYKVYRGVVNGDYECIFETTATSWAGGDPAVPNPGEHFAYLVTGLSPGGQETSPGEPESSRNLLPGGCP